jgi:hypothetical protein
MILKTHKEAKMKEEKGIPRTAAEAARNQFGSCYKMLITLVEVCPDDVWYEFFNGVPFWYQVYHTVYFIDYWFRDDYKADDFMCVQYDKRIPPEFEHDVDNSFAVSRGDMKEYLEKIHVKTARVFDALTDSRLGDPILIENNYTYLDVIMAQTRHIMYNLGYLNGILRSKALEESDWWAYNEKEE